MLPRFPLIVCAKPFFESGSKSRLNETNLWGVVKEVSLHVLKVCSIQPSAGLGRRGGGMRRDGLGAGAGGKPYHFGAEMRDVGECKTICESLQGGTNPHLYTQLWLALHSITVSEVIDFSVTF